MRQGWQVGRLASVPCYIHPGGAAFVLAAAWLMAAFFLPDRFPWLPVLARWPVALLVSLLFAATIVAHEVGHVWATRRRGGQASAITLYFFGAIAWLDEEPRGPADEAIVALAGPLVNGGAALLGAGVAWALAGSSVPALQLVAEIAWLLAVANGLLGGFNVLPAYPLDGGRLLHALLWRMTGERHRATRLTAWLGLLAAAGLLAGGTLWATAWANPFPLISAGALALFLVQGNWPPLRHLAQRAHLAALPVGALVWRDGPLLQPEQTLYEASLLMAAHGTTTLPVVQAERFLGLLTHGELRRVAHDGRGAVRVAEVMRHATLVPHLTPDEGYAALRRMVRAGLVALPVLQEGQWVGLLRQRDVVRGSRLPTRR